MESLDLRIRKCVSWKTAGIIVVVVVLTALVILALYPFSWSGFGSYSNPKGEFLRYKTLWDWLQLLIVPAALALFAYWFTCQRERLARDIEESRTREARLQSYFDRMTELILDKALSSSEPGARVRDIARARTLTVVRGLDGERKGALLRFLLEAHLITAPHPIIKLDRADLRSADLIRADLRNADLSGADLSNANLRNAALVSVNLGNADLRCANLRNAAMDQADLHSADLIQADLHSADLIQADLRNANLSNANLSNADLLCANLSGANLSNADLNEAKDLTVASQNPCANLSPNFCEYPPGSECE